MNALPEHRRALQGPIYPARTWSRPYDPADYDPIQHFHRRTEWRATVVMTVLAVATLAAIYWGAM